MVDSIDGDKKLRDNDLVGAIEIFSQGIKEKPREIENYLGRAKAYRLKGDLNAAIADLTDVIRIWPDVSTGYYGRAQIYCSESGQYDADKAIVDYTRAIDINSYDHHSYLQRAMAFAYSGYFGKAISDMQKYFNIAEKWHPILTKAVPMFIAELEKRDVKDWYRVWERVKHDAGPIDALVMQLWDVDNNKRQQAIDALVQIGEPAIPSLLAALEKDDRNSEVIEYENKWLRSAIVALGKPAIIALSNGLYAKTRLARASAKTLWQFDDPLAKESLQAALKSPDVMEHVRKYYIPESLQMIEYKRNHPKSK